MIDTNVLSHLLAQSRSEDADSREVAARELKGLLPNQEAAAALATLLGDSDWRVRRAAVESFLEARDTESLSLIVEALYEEANAGKRNAAIDVLSRFGKDVLPYLHDHLKTDHPDVQMFLINILGNLRDDSCLDQITGALDDRNANVVSAAIVALGKIGCPESLQHILRFLGGDDLWLKFQAIEAAGEMQDPAVIPHLIQLYESQYCRKPVLKALGRIHHPDAYSALLKFLMMEERPLVDALQAFMDLYYLPQPFELRNQAQERMREFCRKFFGSREASLLMQEFQVASLEVQKQILQILGWAQAADAIPLLLQHLQHSELKETTAQALIDCEGKATEPLLARLKEHPSEEEIVTLLNILQEITWIPEPAEIQGWLRHDSPEIRHITFKLLVKSGSPDVIPSLLEGITDKYLPAAEVCARPLLAQCRRSKSVRKLARESMRQKLRSPDSLDRAQAVDFLASLDPEKAVVLLLQALKDESSVVRQKAVRLMGREFHREFQRPLTAALADEDAHVREGAARTLSRYPSSETVDALISRTRDEVLWVRVATYESLASLGDPNVVPLFLQQMETENPIGRATLLRCLGSLGVPSSKEFILNYLKSEDVEIRRGACEALAAFPDTAVVSQLAALLKEDPDWNVRVSCLRSLTALKPPHLLNLLQERLQNDSDPFVRKEILLSYHKLNVDSLPLQVFQLLTDKDLADSTYDFLRARGKRFSGQIEQAILSESPQVRRILRTLIA